MFHFSAIIQLLLYYWHSKLNIPLGLLILIFLMSELWQGKRLYISPDEIRAPQLVESQLPMVTCIICLMVLSEPLECSKCQSQFCSDCITDFKGSLKKQWKGEECPLRCKPLKTQKSHKFVNSLLLELKIDCPNAGCTDIVNYVLGGKHQKECPHEIVRCSGKPACIFELKRMLISEHEEGCMHVTRKCPYCEEAVPNPSYQNHVESKCLKAPRVCQLCEGTYPRDVLRKHMVTECAQYPVECRHCLKEQVRKDIADHEQNCLYQPVHCTHCKIPHRLLDIENHELNCDKQLIQCTQECGLLIKLKDMESYLVQNEPDQLKKEYRHNCLDHALKKLKKSRAKLIDVKARAECEQDVAIAFQKCCSEESKYKRFAERPLIVLERAFGYMGSVVMESGMYKKINYKEKTAMRGFIDRQVHIKVSHAYDTLLTISKAINYTLFPLIERKPFKQHLEEQKQFDHVDIFGFNMSDEELVEQMCQRRGPNFNLPQQPRRVEILNQQQRREAYYDQDDYMGMSLFGDEY
ncbi:hypothetical protein FGO68_gene11884 [Halteria grandinella]|uniref:Uncharacterized protein n=1 Tax=Halteria grandinella TaxID=5974 RepID=A0A8J8SW60_HALGN|nr:hypothetical protein FGO68_gene11884 [Halteria grandinella]